MNAPTRSVIVMICFGFCAGGLIVTSHETATPERRMMASFYGFDSDSNYQFAASELHKLNFAQLEGIVRADIATKFPSARIEFGSVKVEHGALSMPVVLFGPNRSSRAFLYRLVPGKDSWKIAGSQRLWFVPPSQILRGPRI